jgi:5-methylcytosine-specific restriction endonuclease McrA
MADDETMPTIMSRREAKALGLKSYFDGKPCPKGHIAVKRVDSYGCTECHKSIAKKWEAKGNSDPRRLTAKEAGKITYLGAPCPQGHDGTRNTITGRCAFCTRGRVERWRQKHPEYDATGKTRERRRKNPEKHRKNVMRWAQKNPETTKAMRIRWKKENPEAARRLAVVGAEKRRARKYGNGGSFTRQEIEQLFIKQNGTCAECESTDRLEIDHIMPLCLGGRNDISNLQLLCFFCNRSKGGKHPDDWRKQLRCESA